LSHPHFAASWREVRPEEWKIYEDAPLETSTQFDHKHLYALFERTGFEIEASRFVRVLPAGLIEKYPMLEYFNRLLEEHPECQHWARQGIWCLRKVPPRRDAGAPGKESVPTTESNERRLFYAMLTLQERLADVERMLTEKTQQHTELEATLQRTEGELSRVLQ